VGRDTTQNKNGGGGKGKDKPQKDSRLRRDQRVSNGKGKDKKGAKAHLCRRMRGVKKTASVWTGTKDQEEKGPDN